VEDAVSHPSSDFVVVGVLGRRVPFREQWHWSLLSQPAAILRFDRLFAQDWLCGVQDRAIMLEIRHKDGPITGKGDSWLPSAELDPSSGIVLDFSGNTTTRKKAKPLVVAGG